MSLIGAVEESFKKEVADFNIGDTVRVSVKVVEGDKERIQPFDGVVIATARGQHKRNFHRTKDIIRCRGRKNLPSLFSGRRKNRGTEERERQKGKTLLSERQKRQGGEDQGKREGSIHLARPARLKPSASHETQTPE